MRVMSASPVMQEVEVTVGVFGGVSGLITEIG